MSFDASNIEAFLKIFNNHKNNIRNFDGCNLLELYNDKNNTSTFFTYSYWNSEAHLDAYRNSELFNEVWAKTKILFNAKPEAWSVNKIESLP
jgi:hypothetical protein